MRYLLPVVSLTATVLALHGAFHPSGAEPVANPEDPWTGTYSYFADHDTSRSGQFGEARRITITKEGDFYRLSKPYDDFKFKETKKGHLYDEKAIFGGLTLGSMEFSDGRHARVLRAEFCYEHFYLVGGLDDGKKPDATDPRTTPEKKNPPMKVEEAEKLVREYIFAEKPKMNPTAQFPLKDITTKDVWDRLGVQVFKVTEGVQNLETFVIRNDKVFRIGNGFGGRGVTSLAVADLSGGGQDKLVYAYSWGSGVHRSHVGVFDVLAKEPVQATALQAYFGDLGDLEVKQGEKQTVEVYVGKQVVGKLVMERKDKVLTVGIVFNDDLAAEFQRGFKSLP
jgi:hypothetical protein